MRLEYIHCENFFSHKDLEIDFTTVGSPALVTGENGSGKSSAIVEALTFAIFGQTRNPSVDQSIRDDEAEMAVTVRFILSNQEVEITRRKKRDKTAKLSLIVDGIPVDELLTETQVKINKLFGLSYNSFLSSIILKQEDADFFVKQKPDERKKIIAEILDLNAFERIEKEAKERRTELGREIKGDQAVLQSLEVQDIDELITKFKTITKGVKGLETKAEKTQKSLNEKIKWNAVVHAQIEENLKAFERNLKLNRVIAEGKIQLAADKKSEAVQASVKPPAEYDVAQIEQRIEAEEALVLEQQQKAKDARTHVEKYIRLTLDELQAKKDALVTVRDQYAGEMRSYHEQITKAKGINGIAECPTCMQPIEAKKVEKTLSDLEKAHAEVYKKYQTAEKPIHKVMDAIKLIKDSEDETVKGFWTKVAAAEELVTDWRLKITEKRQLLRIAMSEKQQYDLAQEKLKFLKQRIEDTEKHLVNLEAQISDIPEVTIEEKPTHEEESLIRTLQGQMQQALKLQSQLEAQIEHSRAEEKRREVLTLGLGSKIKLLTMYDKIVEAFSRKGIPASIIATVLPEIQAIANMYLGRMSQGGLHLEFKTTEVLKTGEERDTLDVNVYDGKNWRSFESFSGGEKFRISLSIRLALSKVLTRRAGVELELLILDEPAAPLDDTGKELFFETIMSLRSDFSKIIVMSHLPGLTDEFESRINLRKTVDGSKLVNAA